MEQYISQEFPDGASVEAALLRAKSGGAIDTALQNKAPAGYGYGGVVPADITISNGTEAQLESQLDTVIAAMADGEAKRIRVICTPLLDTQYLCEIFRYASTYVVITGVAAGGFPEKATASRISKAKKNGVWYPLEWENPPMLLGGVDADGNPINEYRTTERYLGKPVYVKLVNFGALPNNTERQISLGISNLNAVIFVSATMSSGDLIPSYNTTNGNKIEVSLVTIYDGGRVRILTNYDASASSAYVKIKYTKTTD